jgi:hypothetical protein
MLHLGMIYKDNVMINHRSLLKIIVNPFLVPFGKILASLFEGDQFIKYIFYRCEKQKFLSRLKETFIYHCNYDYIIKKRIII